jgi:DNA-binding NarL/FixJ family response regulator
VEKIRVIVADDHPFVRIGIRKILSKTKDIVVVGEASDGEQTLDMVKQFKPDVLLLDVEMPRLNGIQVATRLQQSETPVSILVLSAYEDRQHILGMLNRGVSGYLSKEEVPEILVKAVRGVAAGERGWVSQRLAEKMAAWRIQPKDGVFLSPGQREMLKLLAQAMPGQEIATRLGVSEATIDRHIEILHDQLGVTNLEELLHLARKHGLVKDNPLLHH